MSTLLPPGALRDRTAVVTGASSGMGAATASRLAELGAEVALLARRADRLDENVQKITASGGTAIAVPVDVTDRAAVQAAAERIRAELGVVDLVFNNAGVQLLSGIDELAVDDWQRQIDLNVSGVMNTVAAFLPALTAAAAAGRPTDLINSSSIAATRILERFSVYSATKAYISHWTRLARVELGPKMIRVASIEPGMVDTELPDHVTDPRASEMMASLLRDVECLRGEDIAETVAFMAALPRHVNLTEITVFPTAQAA